MTEQNEWARQAAADPEHSDPYVLRFHTLAADRAPSTAPSSAVVGPRTVWASMANA